MATLNIDRLPRNATPGEVLRFVTTHGKIDGKRIGTIAFLGNTAIVDVPDNAASKLVTALDGATFRDYPIRVRLTSKLARRTAPAESPPTRRAGGAHAKRENSPGEFSRRHQ